MDHCPIVIHVPMNLEKIVKPFQFLNYMCDLDGFLEVVNKAWSDQWYGNPMAILCRRLKCVKQELVILNKNRGNAHSNVKTTRAKLKEVQDSLASSPTDQDFLTEEHIIVKNLEKFLLEEEALLLQKSRVKWLQCGDGNNSFFYNQTKANWNRNKIMAIENEEGNIVFGQSCSQLFR